MERLPDKKLIFVYGTLMAGFSPNRLLGEGAYLVGKAHAAGRMYDRGFPGVKFEDASKASGVIHGELWSVWPDAIPHLDSYEGHPRLFKRTEIKVVNEKSGETETASAYQYNGTVEEATLIPSGDYRNHLERRQVGK